MTAVQIDGAAHAQHATFVSYFRRSEDVTPKPRPTTVAALLDELRTITRASAKNGKGFSFAEFRQGGRRVDADVIAVHGLALDIDNAERGIKSKRRVADPLTMDRLAATLAVWDCTYALHPTWSYTADWPRLRIIIPFQEPIDVQTYRALVACVAGILGPAMDSRVAPSYFVYLPSAPHGAVVPEPLVADHRPLLDARAFLAKYSRNEPQARSAPPSRANAPRGETRQAGEHALPGDLSRAGIGRWLRELLADHVGEGARSEQIFAAVAALTRAGASASDILGLLLDPALGISEKPLERGAKWTAADIARIRERMLTEARAKLDAVTIQIGAGELVAARDAVLGDVLARAYADVHALARDEAEQWRARVRDAAKAMNLALRNFASAIVRHVPKRPLALEALAPTVRPTADPDIEPAADPVSTSEAFAAARDTVSKFVSLPQEQVTVVALWTLAAWRHSDFEIFPLLHLHSSEPACGKSTCGGIIASICPRGFQMVAGRLASLFRLIEAERPTLVYDEADALDDESELIQLLNAAHSKGAKVVRFNAESGELERFELFTPVVLAGIDSLPRETVASRSIRIHLAPKPAGEVLLRVSKNRDVLAAAHSRLKRWALDQRPLVASQRVDDVLREAGIENRAADLWEPLLAVAERAGEELFNAALAIAKEATTAAVRDELTSSVGRQLLEDIKQLFDERAEARAQDLIALDPSPPDLSLSWADTATTLTSAWICSQLKSDRFNHRPWARYRNRMHGLDPAALSMLLTPYGIRPRRLTPPANSGHAQTRGYARQDFEAAWSIYLGRVL